MICFGAAVIHMSKTAELGRLILKFRIGQLAKRRPDWISAKSMSDLMTLIALGIGGKAKTPRTDHAAIKPLRLPIHREAAALPKNCQRIFPIRLLKTSMMKRRTIKSHSEIHRRILRHNKNPKLTGE